MTNTYPSADDVLMNSGSAPPSAEFAGLGSRVEGSIVGKPTAFHVTEFRKDNTQGPPQYYPSGDPIMGVKIDVKTPQRMAADDSGIRRIYCQSSRMLSAIKDAVRLSGATGLEAGAYLAVTWVGTEEGKGTIPAKVYTAEYTRPGQTPTPVPSGQPQSAGAQALHRYQQAAQQPVAQQIPAAVQSVTQQHPAPVADVWTGQPAQPQQTYVPTPAPVAQAAPEASNVITSSLAAAMRNAGIDVSRFTIIPG